MKKLFLIFMFLNIFANAQEFANMYFLTKDIGWIQTFDGYCNYAPPINTFRTTDGGVTWTQLNSQYNYRNIQFVNDSVGFLFSVENSSGKNLYKTTDKGETWQYVTDTLKGLENVMFADEMNGYADVGVITAKTTNSGFTWLKESGGGRSTFAVITKNKIIVLPNSRDDKYEITTNGGISWEVKEFPFPYRDSLPIRSGRGLVDIQFTDTLHGFVTTLTINPQEQNWSGIYSTKDGGETWRYNRTYIGQQLSMGDSLNGVEFAGGYYHLTHDGFKTFTQKYTTEGGRFFFYSCAAFYCCGYFGYFAKSTDCGDTWTQLPFYILNPTESSECNQSINDYSLQQNYPNPFNPSTVISYSLPEASNVKLEVFDALGKRIAVLVDEYQSTGYYKVNFNSSQYNLASGIYLTRLSSGDKVYKSKMLLLK